MSHVNLDVVRCQGHGRCSLEAPDLFDVDDAGKALLMVTGELTPGQAAELDGAVVACPERAIQRVE